MCGIAPSRTIRDGGHGGQHRPGLSRRSYANLIVVLGAFFRSELLSGRSAAWLARLVRDQEVDGSNPFAPTNFFNYLRILGLLQIGSIWVQHRLKQSHIRCDSLTEFGADVCIAGCCSQTGMANPLFHQVSRYTIFLKDGHPAVTKGMESPSLQTEFE